jgi:hypothetical protein
VLRAQFWHFSNDVGKSSISLFSRRNSFSSTYLSEMLPFFRTQVDEYLASQGKPKVFSRHFEGVFSDQKICQESILRNFF